MGRTRVVAAAALLVFSMKAFGSRIAGADFLRIQTNPRGLALGEAYTALSDDAGALQWNPAGVALSPFSHVEFTHVEAFAGFRMENLVWSVPMGRGHGLGLGLILFTVADLFDTDEEGFSKPAHAHDFVATFNYSRKLRKSLSAGINARLYQSELLGSVAQGVAIDLGGKYEGPWGLRLGMAILGLGPDIVYDSLGDPLPRWLKVGAGENILAGKGHYLRLALEGGLPLGHKATPLGGMGFEFDFAGRVQLRAGYKMSAGGGGPSAGLGLRAGSLGLQYAFVPRSVLGVNHHIALDLALDPEAYKGPTTAKWTRRGDASLEALDFASAIRSYKEAVKLSPSDPAPLKKLGEAQKAAGQEKESLETFKNVARLDPADTQVRERILEALLHFGEALFDGKDFGDAILFYEEAVRIAPADASLWKRLGWIYYQVRNQAKMMEAYAESFRLNPGDQELGQWLERAHSAP